MPYNPNYQSILEQRQAVLRDQLASILPQPEAAFVWEVGSGHGHFLTAYAAAHPELLCIGIDLIGERIERALRKRDRAKLPNLHFIQAEARLFLQTIPAGGRLGAVFVLFPDPWPKLRHNKHRIMQPAFLAGAANHAIPGCPLYFRTDFGPYFEVVRNIVATDPYWERTADPWPFEFTTVFQQRAGAFHSLVARCKGHPAPTNSVPAIENTE
jgi:tRNA (guanine-N7-)-methyltransferase